MRRSRRALRPAVALAVLLLAVPLPARPAPPAVTPEEARTIAREAFLWGFPMVEAYKVLFAYAVFPGHAEFRAPLNEVFRSVRAWTPADVTARMPNPDVATATAWLELHEEPVVLTLPAVRRGRFFSVQLVDLYTYNFAYLGSRTTGNAGGKYLVAGPGWKGKAPAGIARVIRAETEYVFVSARAQLFGPGDVTEAGKILGGFEAKPLGAFLGRPAPPQSRTVNYPPYDPAKAKTAGFFDYLDFLLLFCPTHPSEVALRERFERIGVVAGKPFDPDALGPEVRKAVESGMEEGRKAIEEAADSPKAFAARVYGTRASLKGNDLNRAVGARLGILGNSAEETSGTAFTADAGGAPLDASSQAYLLKFASGGLPPVNGFWSLTMYDGTTGLLVANPLKRYQVTSKSVARMVRDADGGLTIRIRKDSPGKGGEANWLPAPNGPFRLVLRTYWPKKELVEGRWRPPVLRREK